MTRVQYRNGRGPGRATLAQPDHDLGNDGGLTAWVLDTSDN